MSKLAEEVLKQLRQLESGQKLLRVPMAHSVLRSYSDAEDALMLSTSDAEVIAILSKLLEDLKKIDQKSHFIRHVSEILQKIPAMQRSILNQLQLPPQSRPNLEIQYQLMPSIESQPTDTDLVLPLEKDESSSLSDKGKKRR